MRAAILSFSRRPFSRERLATLSAGAASRLRRKSSPPPSRFCAFDPPFLLRGDEFPRSKTQIFRCANCDLTLTQFLRETGGLALLSRNSAASREDAEFRAWLRAIFGPRRENGGRKGLSRALSAGRSTRGDATSRRKFVKISDSLRALNLGSLSAAL